MENGNCALCKLDKQLCKSHIIPRSIFKKMKKGYSGKLIYCDSKKDSRVRYSSDDWSEHLLCISCEKIIKKYEDYGLKLFRGGSSVEHSKHQSGVSFQNIDYNLLKQYLISLLWRFSVAHGKIFKEIKLNKITEELARVSLLNNTPLKQQVLACRIQRLVDDKRGGGLGKLNFQEFLMAPFKRYYGNNVAYYALIEGFLFEFFPKNISYKHRKVKGILSTAKVQLFPYVFTPDVWELVETMGVARTKELYSRRKKPNKRFNLTG